MGLFKKKEQQGPQSFKCEYCNMKFDDKERMKRHVKKAHSERGGDMPNMNPFGFG